MTRPRPRRAGEDLLPRGRASQSVVVVLALALGALAVVRLAVVAQGIFHLAAEGSPADLPRASMRRSRRGLPCRSRLPDPKRRRRRAPRRPVNRTRLGATWTRSG
ncbi:MAG TPA: hypothetical protein VLE23_16835 [Geminicoccaceae bacterium]|nr:hypothetical protein [Geminicoccaceae bacterium]